LDSISQVYSLVKATIGLYALAESFVLGEGEPTSFLVPLPGNGSNTSTRTFQLYDYPSYHMEFSPSYLAVPSREYMEPPPSSHPILSDGYEICPSLVAMVCSKSFSGRKDEYPYAHLREFEENCSLLTIPGINQNTLWWKLFSFSLMGNAKVSYNQTTGRVGGDWIQLKEEFCLFFFPISKVIPHRMELLSFKQNDGEPLGVAWARFMQSATSGPPHNVQEEMLMQHFIYGLNPESSHFMNLASEGSVMYKTVAEVRTTLERVLNTTQYT